MIAALELCLSLVASEDRLGDLAEAYAQDARTLGEGEGRRRYRRHLLSSIASIAWCGLGGLLQNEVPAGAAAVLIALTGYGCVVRATAETWWIKSGFEHNPGYFISENRIDYPVCEAWTEDAAGRHVTPSWSRAVLVPKSARITKVYCGASGKPLGLSDNNYTRGRVLTAPVAFRVVWEE